MIDQLHRVRRVIAVPIALAMGTLAFGVPLLDAGPRGELPSLQAEDEAAGSAGHDHSICVLQGASAWSAAEQDRVAPPVPASAASDALPVPRAHARIALTATQPRAPPFA